MLEYLKCHEALYPYYQMVELLALREEHELRDLELSFFQQLAGRVSQEMYTYRFNCETEATQLHLLTLPNVIYNLQLTDTLIATNHYLVAQHLLCHHWPALTRKQLRLHLYKNPKWPWRELYFECMAINHLTS